MARRLLSTLTVLLVAFLTVHALVAGDSPFGPTEAERVQVERLAALDGTGDGPSAEILRDALRRLEAHETLRLRFESLYERIRKRDDRVTAPHCRRVGAMAARFFEIVARAGGMAPEKIPARADALRWAGTVHDLGKTEIAPEILDKAGPLDATERGVMEGHSRAGSDALLGGTSAVETLSRHVALSHHERWDGRGYPEGLAGTKIPLSARIVAVVDVYDSLVNRRGYKEAWPLEKVLSVMEAEDGKLFDPSLLRQFLAHRGEIEAAGIRSFDGEGLKELRVLRDDLKLHVREGKGTVSAIRSRSLRLLSRWGSKLPRLLPVVARRAEGKGTGTVARGATGSLFGDLHRVAPKRPVATRVEMVKARVERAVRLR